jgi:UDP:flavonoid glycosyltransferase YjiC (YdhE family)
MSESTVAVAHYCEGAGHATRMLAIATAIEDAGYEIVLAGGGPGTPFVEANGYEEFEPTPVDFVTDYQRGGTLDTLRHSVPNTVRRVREYRDWLDTHDPDLLVTDDPTAAVAAWRDSQCYFYLAHDPAELYTDWGERAGARVRNGLPLRTAERFFHPKVWAGEPAITGAEPIPPIAPDSGSTAEPVDVLLVPSAFSLEQSRVVDLLEDRGHEVTVVGGDEWTTQPSLQPSIENATLVVCSGYSTIMEAAVAGTPCLVLPSTSEQRGVAGAIEDIDGFATAETIEELSAALDELGQPEAFDNGVPRVVEAVPDAF